MKNIVKLFEISRTLCAAIGFYIAYVYYFSHEYFVALNILIIFLVIPLTGITGIESIFFADVSALSKGWTTKSPYQIQSGINNIAIALTAIIILVLKWNIYSQLTILFVTLIFFTLSAINHSVSFFKQKNKKKIHILRPIFSLLMILASMPIIIQILQAQVRT